MNIYIYDLRRECKFIGLKCISVLHDALYICVCVHMYAYIILLILYVLHIFIPFQILKKILKFYTSVVFITLSLSFQEFHVWLSCCFSLSRVQCFVTP